MPVCQNFRYLRSTVEKSCCPRTNITGRIQMRSRGTSRRRSINSRPDRSHCSSAVEVLERNPAAQNVILQNGADGISDIEGKVAMVATREFGNERVSNQIRSLRSRPGFSCALSQYGSHEFPRTPPSSFKYAKLIVTNRRSTRSITEMLCQPQAARFPPRSR